MSDAFEKDLGEVHDAADQAVRASAIATNAHRGQVDKVGDAYIDHPRRVSARVAGDPLAVPAAWLHDVVEDCGVTAEDLRDAGVHRGVIEAVLLLTRMEVDHAAYYQRIAAHPVAPKYEKALQALGAGPADR